MIELSAAAQQQLRQLTRHYADLGRDRAIVRRIESIERAGIQYSKDEGQFFSAPRPYPSLVKLNIRWTKESSYWIAFSERGGSVRIVAIFYDWADIPRRFASAISGRPS